MINRFAKVLGAVGVSAGMFATVASPAVAQQALRMATIGTANNPIAKCGPIAFSNDLVAKSNGKLKLETYLTGSAFANPTKLYDEAEKGIVDVTWGVVSYTPNRFPLTELAGLPFVVNDHEAGSRAVSKLTPEYLKDEHKNVHLISLPLVSNYQFLLRKPMTRIEDLQGMRLRASGKGVVEGLKALGANVAVLPATLVYENLQKGVVDGTVGTFAGLIAFKLAEVTTDQIQMDFGGNEIFFVMNQKYYDRLSSDLKAVVDSYSTPEAAQKLSSCFTRVDKAGLALAKKLNGNYRMATKEERAAAMKIVEPVNRQIVADLDAKGLKASAFHAALTKAVAEEESKGK